MKPHLLKVAGLPETLTRQLHEHFTVNDLGPKPEPDALRGAASVTTAMVANGESVVKKEMIAQLPNLGLIAVCGVGYDGVDVTAARAQGANVTHTPGVLTDDVADLAMGLLLAAARQFSRADRFVREGRWAQGPLPFGRKVSGGHLGILGLGRIGTAIARRAEAFGMRISYHNRRPRSDTSFAYHPSLMELATAVDFLVVCAQGGASTRHLVNSEVIDALGPQGILVNVGRGSIVDEEAVAVALREGRLLAAGLDVFEREPHVLAALLTCENAVLTPHIGSATASTRQAMGDLVLANLQAFFAGQPLLTPVP